MTGDCDKCKHLHNHYKNKIDELRLKKLKKILMEALAEIGDDYD